jgi:hypothetical protein
MNRDILTKKQIELLPLIKKFSSSFYLVGGTAVALYLGHRRSVDFDLFTQKVFNPLTIRQKITRFFPIESTLIQGEGELTVIVNQVKLTFFYYPYPIPQVTEFADIITLPSLLDLASMKAFSLGKRAKWKDYVDLYFILQKYSLKEIIFRSKELFHNEFNEKLFRAQLSYFDDIDYSEEIEFMPGFEKKQEEIKKFLEEISLSD